MSTVLVILETANGKLRPHCLPGITWLCNAPSLRGRWVCARTSVALRMHDGRTQVARQ